MSEEIKEKLEKFEIRIDGTPPHTAFVCVPIEAYANDLENGMALLHGKMREAQANISRMIVEIRKRNQQLKPSVIGADGKPLIVH